VRLKVRHVYDFGEDRRFIGSRLSGPASWDAVRDLEGPFEIPLDRGRWERRANRSDLAARACDIVAIARGFDAHVLCSYGVGTGALELNVHRAAPDLALVCGDYAPGAVDRLRTLFVEATVRCHDFASDSPLDGDLHLMHRLDAELDDSEWRVVFARFHEPVLFVPNLLLNLRIATKELARGARFWRATSAGWYRNEDALRSLWARTHDDRPVRVGSARAFLLLRR
jgi:hypothetical protein